MTEGSERREEILSASAELFGAKGVKATSVRDIADAVGMLSGSLYHHFPSKQSIVDEILARYLEDLQKTYAEMLTEHGEPSDHLRGLIRSSLQVASRHPHASEIYQNDVSHSRSATFAGIREVSRDIQRTWLTVIEAGVASKEFRDDIEPAVFYRLLRDAVWLSVRWYRPSATYTVDQLADDAATIFLSGYTNSASGRKRKR